MKKGTIFYKKKMSRETILTIVYLFLTGYPISNMPPLVHVTERSQYTKTEGFVTYALFGQSKQSVEDRMASLGLGKKITTALIESLNSQIRDLCNYMRRRSKRIPRLLSWGEKAISGFKFLHNFLKAHLTLSETSSKNWITVPVTPCMNAGICNHQISLIEILTFRF